MYICIYTEYEYCYSQEAQLDSLLDCAHVYFRAAGKLLNSTSQNGTSGG